MRFQSCRISSWRQSKEQEIFHCQFDSLVVSESKLSDLWEMKMKNLNKYNLMMSLHQLIQSTKQVEKDKVAY